MGSKSEHLVHPGHDWCSSHLEVRKMLGCRQKQQDIFAVETTEEVDFGVVTVFSAGCRRLVTFCRRLFVGDCSLGEGRQAFKRVIHGIRSSFV